MCTHTASLQSEALPIVRLGGTLKKNLNIFNPWNYQSHHILRITILWKFLGRRLKKLHVLYSKNTFHSSLVFGLGVKSASETTLCVPLSRDNPLCPSVSPVQRQSSGV